MAQFTRRFKTPSVVVLALCLVCSLAYNVGYQSVGAAVVADNPWIYNPRDSKTVITGVVDITKSDTDELVRVVRAVGADGAGNISVVFVDGTTRVFPIGAGPNERIEGFIRQVKSTSTTATGIYGFY